MHHSAHNSVHNKTQPTALCVYEMDSELEQNKTKNTLIKSVWHLKHLFKEIKMLKRMRFIFAVFNRKLQFILLYPR